MFRSQTASVSSSERRIPRRDRLTQEILSYEELLIVLKLEIVF